MVLSRQDAAALKVVSWPADALDVGAELDKKGQRAVGRKAREAVLEALRTLRGEGLRREILEAARRNGRFTEAELDAPAPEKWRSKHASYVEYRLSFALTNLKHEGLLENPRWSVWRLTGVAADEPAPAAKEPIPSGRLAELRRMNYRDYLCTPEWRRARAAALVRAGYRCALDRSHTEDLEVHHNTYERIGAELASDLIVLCHDCHRHYHEANGRPRRPKTAASSQAARVAASFPPPSTSSATAGTQTPRRRSLWQRLLAGD